MARNGSLCSLCPRCRNDCESFSFCGNEQPLRCFRHRIECGEESCLCPSQLFYLSGCNLRCNFCIGEERAFDTQQGQPLTQEFFQNAIEWGLKQGAKTVQWVGGDPGIHLPKLVQLMKNASQLPPVVWKSNFYFYSESLKPLEPFVDYYVADFKFGNDRCAAELCGVGDYVQTVTTALQTVYRLRPNSLIVRHLLIPGHFACCFRPVLDWFLKKTPEAIFSLRNGYIPAWRAKSDPQLQHWLDPLDAEQAEKLVRQYCAHVA